MFLYLLFKILLESDEKRNQVYSNIFFQKIVTKEELRNTKYKKSIEYESNLNSVELFASIKEIEGIELIELIKERSPEYCILGLAAIQPHWEDIFDELLIQYSEGSSSHFIHNILFTKYNEKMFYSFNRITDRVSLTKILDIFLEHKMPPVVSEVLKPKRFCFDLNILSSRRDHLNLEVWLNNNFTNIGPIFISYMHSKLILKTSDGNLDSNSDEVVQNQYIPMVKQEDSSSIKLKTDAEIFPFNKSIAATICKILESKEIDPHLFNLFNQFKRYMKLKI